MIVRGAKFKARSDEVGVVEVEQRSEVVLSLFEQYYTRVYAFVRRSTTADTAEDIAQEVFVRLLERPNIEKIEISVSYLLKIADNLIKRRYRRSQRARQLIDERARFMPRRAPSRNPNGRPPAARSAEGTAALLDKLNGRERDAVRLIVCEGLSYDAAARSLGVTVSTVNNWKYRGLRKLRDHAQPHRSLDSSPPRTVPSG
ncbi:MAG: RNA polymerase sigma factor [Phycisphaerales bacterium]